MPRESQKSIKGRTQVNPQATFDFTVPRRETSARPVNMDVEVAGDFKKTAILTFIDQMSGLAKDVTRYSDTQNIERRKEGSAAKGRGDELPEDPHWAFLEGYELMSGASDAYTYEQELAELLSTDITSDVQTFNEKKDAISNKYLIGRNDAYIEGFMSRAMNVEANAEMKFQEAKTQQMQEDFLIKGVKLFKLDYREHKATGASLEENSLAGRELATELQAAGADYGLTKAEVSKRLVKNIGSGAAITGNPEDMMWMFEPDEKGGTALIDTSLAPAIHSYLNSAISTRQSLAKEAMTEKTRIEKEFAITAGKAIVKALDNDDPALGQKILEDTGQYMNLDDYTGMTKAIRDMRQGSNTFFSSFTDQFSFDNLRISAKAGRLTLEQLQTEQASLTKADYRRVFSDIVTKWQEDIARSRAGGKKTSHQITMEKARKNGERLVAQTDTLNKILNPFGASRRLVFYTVHFDDIYEKRAAEVGGAEKMTSKDDQYVIDKTAFDSFIYERPINTETMVPNPDEITKPTTIDKQKQSSDHLENALDALP